MPPAARKSFVVVRVDRDPLDTHASEIRNGDDQAALLRALDFANPDQGSHLEWAIVPSTDAGAARLARVGVRWQPITAALQRQLEARVDGEGNVRPRGNPSRRKNADDNQDDQWDGEIADGAARALWVTSYADWVESLPRAEQRELGPGAGGDWCDVAPKTPATADQAAAQFVARLVQGNQVGNVTELVRKAAAADGLRRGVSSRYADSFGHYLAMQALGHGVSWFDDHHEFPINIPSMEAHTFDGTTLEWSPQNTANPPRGRRR